MGRLRKAEYIERYGKEAWEEERKKRNAVQARYRENNPEKCREAAKRYYANNAEHYREKSNNWRKNNPEKTRESRKKSYTKNADKRRKESKEWRTNHPEEYKLRKRNYEKTQKGKAGKLVMKYNRDDKVKRGLNTSNNINSKFILENIFTSSCIYCGDNDWTHLGCDRIDNTKPHTPENCVPCCFICNVDRGDRYTVEEFKEYRKLNPRVCDIPKTPVLEFTGSGALKKRKVKEN